jgi:hypothetical protein
MLCGVDHMSANDLGEHCRWIHHRKVEVRRQCPVKMGAESLEEEVDSRSPQVFLRPDVVTDLGLVHPRTLCD